MANRTDRQRYAVELDTKQAEADLKRLRGAGGGGSSGGPGQGTPQGGGGSGMTNPPRPVRPPPPPPGGGSGAGPSGGIGVGGVAVGVASGQMIAEVIAAAIRVALGEIRQDIGRGVSGSLAPYQRGLSKWAGTRQFGDEQAAREGAMQQTIEAIGPANIRGPGGEAAVMDLYNANLEMNRMYARSKSDVESIIDGHRRSTTNADIHNALISNQAMQHISPGAWLLKSGYDVMSANSLR